MAIPNNMKMAEKTYGTFLGLVKWGSIGAASVVILVVLLIAA